MSMRKRRQARISKNTLMIDVMSASICDRCYIVAWSALEPRQDSFRSHHVNIHNTLLFSLSRHFGFLFGSSLNSLTGMMFQVLLNCFSQQQASSIVLANHSSPFLLSSPPQRAVQYASGPSHMQKLSSGWSRPGLRSLSTLPL